MITGAAGVDTAVDIEGEAVTGVVAEVFDNPLARAQSTISAVSAGWSP